MAEESTALQTRWEDVPAEAMGVGISRQFVVGAEVMLARVVLETGAHVPLHSHPNEQMTNVLTGSLRFRLGDAEVVLRAGEVLPIPPNVPHEAWALESTVVFDIFTPPRADWIAARAKV